MYHPTTMGALAQARQDDLRREAEGTWRLGQTTTTGGGPRPSMIVHRRLVTAAVTLLVAFGFVALT